MPEGIILDPPPGIILDEEPLQSRPAIGQDLSDPAFATLPPIKDILKGFFKWSGTPLLSPRQSASMLGPLPLMLSGEAGAGVAEAGAEALSGMTSPAMLGTTAAMLIPGPHQVAGAGIFAGLGAKGVGESLGAQSVAADVGDEREAAKQGLNALLAGLMTLPAVGSVARGAKPPIIQPKEALPLEVVGREEPTPLGVILDKAPAAEPPEPIAPAPLTEAPRVDTGKYAPALKLKDGTLRVGGSHSDMAGEGLEVAERGYVDSEGTFMSLMDVARKEGNEGKPVGETSPVLSPASKAVEVTEPKGEVSLQLPDSGRGGGEVAPKLTKDNPKPPKEAKPSALEGPIGEAQTLKEKLQAAYNSNIYRSLPKASAASEPAAGAMYEYANADNAARALAESMATDVMDLKHKSPEFSRTLGAVLLEDRLRAIRKAYEKAGDTESAANVVSIVGRKGSPLSSEADFIRALESPDIQGAIKRHKTSIQPFAEAQHTQLGGTLADAGDITGAFVNLLPLFEDAAAAKDFVFGTSKGDLSAPLRRGSVFSKKAKGTAEEYDYSYRNMAEKMVRGNYVENFKQNAYTKLIEAKLAVEKEPGGRPPTIGGQRTQKFTIERKGIPAGDGKARTYIKELWVRDDIAPEVRQMLQTDSKVTKGWTGAAFDAVTSAQTALGVDAVWHSANVVAGVNGVTRLKTGKNVLGVREIDTIERISRNVYRALLNDPKVQREIAEYSQYSSGRSSRDISKYNLFGHIVDKVDKAGRLTMNEMYKEMLEAGVVKDSTVNRAQFMEQIGQYNERLMSKMQQTLRDYGISPFVVAGRTFNALSIKRLLLDPGVQAANPKAALKMRAQNLVGLLTTVAVAPPLINYMLTGKVTGRPGTPLGAIDTGKDNDKGRHIVVDPAQWLMLRRGARITGLGAVARGIKEGQGLKQIAENAGTDILQGFSHPFIGPSVDSLALLMMGRDVSGFTRAENERSLTSRGAAALKHLNPTIGAAFDEEGKGVGETFGSAIGVKTSRGLNMSEQAAELSKQLFNKGLGELTTFERKKVSQAVQDRQPEKTGLEKKRLAELAVSNTFEREKQIAALLKPESRDFLKAKGIDLPAPRFSSDTGGVAIPFTDKERELFLTELTKENERVVGILKSMNLDGLTKAQKERRAAHLFEGAHHRATVRVKQSRPQPGQ